MQDPIILHVLVIGFHHKKGCQVEFAFPPLCPDAPESQGLELPDPWKHLPSLALPDGAHNYQKDTIYFHLPSLESSRQTIFGVSCFRQISSESLKNRTEEITRGSVQKSVCVLSVLPLYGLIQTKLELITHAYFEERDFSQVSLLEDTYSHLNATLSREQIWGSQLFLGLSVRDLILHFKHKVLILFKLFLLERKVLFYKSPVEELCSTILTLCSLFPGMLEKGLEEAAANLGLKPVIPSLSPSIPIMSDNVLDTDCVDVSFPTENSEIQSPNKSVTQPTKSKTGIAKNSRTAGNSNDCSDHAVQSEKVLASSDVHSNLHLSGGDTVSNISRNSLGCESSSIRKSVEQNCGDAKVNLSSLPEDSQFHEKFGKNGNAAVPNHHEETLGIEDELMKEIDEVLLQDKVVMTENSGASETRVDLPSMPSSSSLVTLDLESCGLPLAIFTKGSMCLPYLSLPFIESLSDLSIRSCVVGATNVLFKQKRHLFDVVVEIDAAQIQVLDLELSRQLTLSMEDLRFAENLVQHVTGENKDVFLDGTGWEGGEEWLRAQFRLYLLNLLKTADSNGVREQEAFNPSFIQAWQETHNFKVWQSNHSQHLGLQQVEAKHPYQKGQITMSDMKLKLSHSMQSTEKGRKINQAVTSTGKAVMQTGRAVGGALTSARSFVSSWLTNTNTSPQQISQQSSPAEDRSPEMEMTVIRNDSPNSDTH